MQRFLSVLRLVLLPAALFASDENDAEIPETGEALVTIEHMYGTTVLTEYPQRVVSFGYSEHDTILALGVTPVAVRDWYGDMPFATWPWATDELGDAEPVVLSASEPDFEAIAALNPDVILGITSGMEEKHYTSLSKIAPVIPALDFYPPALDFYGPPWREKTRTIAKVLGREAEAEELIARIDARIESIADTIREAGGVEAAVSFVYNNNPVAYISFDPRSRFIRELGFTAVPPMYDEIFKDDSLMISFEYLDLHDIDLIIWMGNSDEALQVIRDLPLRRELNAVKEGRELFLGKILSSAFSFAGPLSIQYLLDELEAGLVAAMDGDPATEVPEQFR